MNETKAREVLVAVDKSLELIEWLRLEKISRCAGEWDSLVEARKILLDEIPDRGPVA